MATVFSAAVMVSVGAGLAQAAPAETDGNKWDTVADGNTWDSSVDGNKWDVVLMGNKWD